VGHTHEVERPTMKSGTSPKGLSKVLWVGQGSTKILPPAEYWLFLAQEIPGGQIERLKEQSDQRHTEFTTGDLPGPEADALALLMRFASDGWVERRERHRCPECGEELNAQAITELTCPSCRKSFVEKGGVVDEIVFVRELGAVRSVDWVVAIHGMNTAGAWQEQFSWKFSTTWGRSVPVAVYKYGFVIVGVVLAWRRRKFQRELRTKLAALRNEARAQGFFGHPDVIAHSFGTWLFGHLLQDELKRNEADRLQFGRIILAGCILRPDFDWKRIREAHLVEDVLNHYGTADRIVPLAHVTIIESGPSGRRGFDGDQVLNIQAVGFGHSDLFSTDKRAENGLTFLSNSYQKYWRPFLTLPATELATLPDRMDPQAPWRQFSWPLRGTLFPFLALPLVLTVACLLGTWIGRLLLNWQKPLLGFAEITAAGLVLLLGCSALVGSWRNLRRRRG
jgi:hypothetical protein